MHHLLSRLFTVEEINGGEMCPTYMFRWTLLKLGRWCSVYVHQFVADDWARDLHDHPKRFISIGLWGRYVEEVPGWSRVYRAPWIRTFPPNHIHRISLCADRKPCWTLVIVFRAVRAWGFWHEGGWIHWPDYVGSETAKRMKACD